MTAVLTPAQTNNAIYECCAANDQWPTLMELSKHLGVSPVEVHARLNDLVAKRMIRQRELDRRYVWLPWGEG
jgi:DNA-binding IclR family transcriptional regulator